MTADLDLWLRGLWRHPNPCRHGQVLHHESFADDLVTYTCLFCRAVARVRKLDIVLHRGQALPSWIVWERP